MITIKVHTIEIEKTDFVVYNKGITKNAFHRRKRNKIKDAMKHAVHNKKAFGNRNKDKTIQGSTGIHSNFMGGSNKKKLDTKTIKSTSYQ